MKQLFTQAGAVGSILILLLSGTVLADEAFQPQYDRTINVNRTQGKIDIDGDLHDPGWGGATRATGWVETRPGDQVEPTVKTEAMIAYDESCIYVAIICWDNPAEVRASMSDRDNIFRDDYVAFLLDTYGDRTWGYELFCNPLGYQGDIRVSSEGNEDGSLEIVFESRGIVTDSGYQVEMAIPFASLRFPNKDVQTWRCNFWRDRQREHRYRYSWVAQDRDNSCWICQWGELAGVKGIRPGKNLEILPNVIAYQSGSRTESWSPASHFETQNPDAELSLNTRYGITSNSSAEVCLNPDFSQVESDAGQIDVNSTFALYFSEQRPFFMEGADLFDTWLTTVYTRSINDPSVAGRFTGQFGRTTLAYIAARDENSPYIVPLQQKSRTVALEESWVNIIRARQTFWQDSYLGLTVTDRRFDASTRDDGAWIGDGSGTTYSLDGRFRLSGNQQIEIQYVGSRSAEPTAAYLPELDTTQAYGTAQSHFDNGAHTVALDGESYNGHAFYASFEHSSRHMDFDLDWYEYSPTYRTPNGFTTRNDTRSLDMDIDFSFSPNRDWLSSWACGGSLGRAFAYGAPINLDPGDYDDGAIDEWLRARLSGTFKSQTEVYLSYLQSRERFGGMVFPGISLVDLSLSTRPSAQLSVGGSLNYGHAIYRRTHREYDAYPTPTDTVHVSIVPEMGVQTAYSLWADLKLGPRLRIQPTLDYARMDHRQVWLDANPDEDQKIYSGYILRNYLTYQFSREWLLRLIVEYDDFGDALSLEPLVTYKLNPYTVFYLGFNSNFQRFDKDDYGLGSDVTLLSRQQAFAKLQYLFRV